MATDSPLENAKKIDLMKIAALALAFFGFIVMIISLSVNIMGLKDKEGGAGGHMRRAYLLPWDLGHM